MNFDVICWRQQHTGKQTETYRKDHEWRPTGGETLEIVAGSHDEVPKITTERKTNKFYYFYVYISQLNVLSNL